MGDRDTLQTLIYLKLSIAGHLTIFVTRTKGSFWSIAPAPVLLIAVLGTQVVATLIAVYGIFMPPWAVGLIHYLKEILKPALLRCSYFDFQRTCRNSAVSLF